MKGHVREHAGGPHERYRALRGAAPLSTSEAAVFRWRLSTAVEKVMIRAEGKGATDTYASGNPAGVWGFHTKTL